MSAIHELRQLYKNERVIPFLGAGTSMAVSWTDAHGQSRRGLSWQELVEEAARILGFDPPDLLLQRGDYLQIFEYLKCKELLTRLKNILVTNSTAPEESLRQSLIHSQLASMNGFSTFYTTNFDNYLEQALTLHGRDVRVLATEAHFTSKATGCDVVKFHGDLEHPERMVLTELDYQTRLRFDSPMDWKLQSDTLGKAILFIGYSFRDTNVSYLYRLINEKLSSLPNSVSGRRGYILLDYPSDFEYTLFRARNIEVVPICCRKKESGVVDILREISEA